MQTAVCEFIVMKEQVTWCNSVAHWSSTAKSSKSSEALDHFVVVFYLFIGFVDGIKSVEHIF